MDVFGINLAAGDETVSVELLADAKWSNKARLFSSIILNDWWAYEANDVEVDEDDEDELFGEVFVNDELMSVSFEFGVNE